MTMSNNNDLQRAGDTNAASGSRGPSAALIVFGLIAVLTLVFFLQNSEPVFIDFLVFEKKTTIRWSILMAIVFGVLLDRLAAVWWRRRRNAKKDD